MRSIHDGPSERLTKVNCSTSFVLATQFPKIIWCGRSMLLSICPGFAASLRLTIRPWVTRKSIRSELMIRMLVVGYVPLRSASGTIDLP